MFKISKAIGRDYAVDLQDIPPTKKALMEFGLYEVPSYGMNTYPDEAMFDGIERFQEKFGLRRDGVMKPGGETEAAFNHVLIRDKVRKSPAKINAGSLYQLFDQFSRPDFHEDGSAGSTRCCATGTCDISA